MLISQIIQADGSLAVVVREGSEAAIVRGAVSTYALAQEALAKSLTLSQVIMEHGLAQEIGRAHV